MARKKKRRRSLGAPHFSIRFDLFPDEQVAVCLSEKRAGRWCSHRNVDSETMNLVRTSQASASYLIGDNGHGLFLMTFTRKAVPTWTVYHECLHMAWHLLRHRGIRPRWNSQETINYLQGYLARQVIAGLKKRGRYAR